VVIRETWAGSRLVQATRFLPNKDGNLTVLKAPRRCDLLALPRWAIRYRLATLCAINLGQSAPTEVIEMPDTSIKKVQARFSPHGEMGQKYLVSGKRISMRLWALEPGGEVKRPTRREHLHPQGPRRSIFGRAERAVGQLQAYGKKRIFGD